MKIRVLYLVLFVLFLVSCNKEINAENIVEINTSETSQNSLEKINMTNVNKNMRLKVDGNVVEVDWENNESVEELKKLAESGLTIQTHHYGGFEQVGEIGQGIVSNNVQMTTEPGDIVLYAGSNVVVFYGSNSWSYTKLGKIKNRTNEELKSMLGKNGVILELELSQRKE